MRRQIYSLFGICENVRVDKDAAVFGTCEIGGDVKDNVFCGTYLHAEPGQRRAEVQAAETDGDGKYTLCRDTFLLI